MAVQLGERRHWLFDMDGTLTNAIHDFDEIRTTLGLPAGEPILESLAALPAAERLETHARLDALELDIAASATEQPGAADLLGELTQRGCAIGIVTRNGRAIADATLAACGLDHFFTPESIVSRDCAAPKPDPAGIHLLLKRWQADAKDAVMVGDYLFDLEAGFHAGAATVHMDINGNFSWPQFTDVNVTSLAELKTLSLANSESPTTSGNQ